MCAILNKEFKKLLIVKTNRDAIERGEYDIQHYVKVLGVEQPDVYIAAVSVVALDDIEAYIQSELASSTDKYKIYLVTDPDIGERLDFVKDLVEQHNATIPRLESLFPPFDISSVLVEIEERVGELLLPNNVYMVDHKATRYLYIKGVFFAVAVTTIINDDPVPEWLKQIHYDGITNIFQLLKCSHYDNEPTDTILRRVLQKFVSSGHRLDFGDEIQHHRVFTSRNTKHMELVLLHSTEQPEPYDDIIVYYRDKHALASINVHTLSFHADKADIRKLFHTAHNNNSLADLVFDESVDKSSPLVKQYTDLFLEMSQ